jgi:mRNA deadenylase 3'-5' endonuclease subunit Ccr4
MNLITVLQWNTLADHLCTEDSFPYTDKNVLNWEFRKNMYLKQIQSCDPDIICLQEVDHYDYFVESLKNYTGIYAKKSGNDSVDGCAIFYKKSKFNCITHSTFRILDDQSQVAIFANLECKKTNTVFYVATSHLKAKYGEVNETIRYKEINVILNYLKKYIKNNDPTTYPCVIFCGDLNDTPDSVTVQRILQDDLNLANAYSEYTLENDKYFTTNKKRAIGTVKRVIDYIFHNDSLTLHKIFPIQTFDLLPNNSYPSDHLAIIAQFVY